MSAAEIRQAIALSAKQLEFTVGGVSFELVRIDPGEFEMGSPEDETGHDANESPMRRIRISRAFYLARYEITQAQYRAVTGINPSNFRGDTLAVDQIIYQQALEFCARLSQLVGVTVTLPTEAQWEYACRAGTKTRFYSGSTQADLEKIAWYAGNAGGTVHPVGQKQPNAWGLYDMLGNVWELCLDFIDSYEEMADTDSIGEMYLGRGAMRGGGHLHGAEYSRAACRLMSNVRFGGAGIRIAINP